MEILISCKVFGYLVCYCERTRVKGAVSRLKLERDGSWCWTGVSFMDVMVSWIEMSVIFVCLFPRGVVFWFLSSSSSRDGALWDVRFEFGVIF